MPRKTNCIKNGQEYFRVTASIGRDSDGKLIRKEFYGKSKKEAEDLRDEYLKDIEKGLTRDREAELGPVMYTWLFEVMRISEKIKPATFERYEGIYRNYVKDSDIYRCKLRTLKSIEIQRYYNKLYETEKKSNSVIKNLNKLLKNFLNYATEEGYLLNNPCLRKRISIPGEAEAENPEIEVFSKEELYSFQRLIEGHQFEALFLSAMGTGLREGELLALRENDVDIKNCSFSIDETMRMRYVFKADGSKEYKLVTGTTKNRQTRNVPFPPKLLPILKAYMLQKKKEKIAAGSSYKDEGYFFSNSFGGPVDARVLLRSYKRALKNANVKYRKFHSLRHTYATSLFEKDVALKNVQELLGHNSPDTTSIYTHVTPKKKIEAVEKINDLFL